MDGLANIQAGDVNSYDTGNIIGQAGDAEFPRGHLKQASLVYSHRFSFEFEGNCHLNGLIHKNFQEIKVKYGSIKWSDLSFLEYCATTHRGTIIPDFKFKNGIGTGLLYGLSEFENIEYEFDGIGLPSVENCRGFS